MEHTPLKMEEIQQVALSILKKIDSVCKCQNLHYTLAFGTLIGAIRHKGFIPWDDDIDIMMPRPDYEKLLDYLHNHPIDDLDVFYWKFKKNYAYGITRVCDSRYHIIEEGRYDCGMGIFVDIYPLDGLANNREDALTALHRADYYKRKIQNFIHKDNRKFLISKNLIKQIIHVAEMATDSIKGLQYYQKKYEQKAKEKPFNNFKYVGIPNWHFYSRKNAGVYQKDWFNEYITIQFENAAFFAIKAYDAILQEDYGDYMQLPPIEKRIYQHCYTAYKIK